MSLNAIELVGIFQIFQKDKYNHLVSVTANNLSTRTAISTQLCSTIKNVAPKTGNTSQLTSIEHAPRTEVGLSILGAIIQMYSQYITQAILCFDLSDNTSGFICIFFYFLLFP